MERKPNREFLERDQLVGWLIEHFARADQRRCEAAGESENPKINDKPDVQRRFREHMAATKQWKHWVARTETLRDEGKIEQARKALAEAQRWLDKMEALERKP